MVAEVVQSYHIDFQRRVVQLNHSENFGEVVRLNHSETFSECGLPALHRTVLADVVLSDHMKLQRGWFD